MNALEHISTEALETELRRRRRAVLIKEVGRLSELFHPFHSAMVQDPIWPLVVRQLVHIEESGDNTFGEMRIDPGDLKTLLSGLEKLIEQMGQSLNPTATLKLPATQGGCPSPGMEGREDRCGLFSNPPRCGPFCTSPDAPIESGRQPRAERLSELHPSEQVVPQGDPPLFLGAMSLPNGGLLPSVPPDPESRPGRYVPDRICQICNKDVHGHQQEVDADEGSGHAFRGVQNVSNISFDTPEEG
jgi:hypothetical protein